jgi:hypothetical protein
METVSDCLWLGTMAIQRHAKRVLGNGCNTILCRTVSRNFSFADNAATFSPDLGVYLRVYIASQPRRTAPPSSSLRESHTYPFVDQQGIVFDDLIL